MKARLFVLIGTLVLVRCGGQTSFSTPGPDGSAPATSGAGTGSSAPSGASGGSSTGAAPGAGCFADSTFDGGPRPAPADHRALPKTCATSPLCTSMDAGTGHACSTDADCAGVDGSFNPLSSCLRGQCSFDQCLDDSDCPSNQVCSCSADSYGGLGCHSNACVPATCHVDANCGPGGFCSPDTSGHCGYIVGYHCHKPTDPCFNNAECGLVTSPGGCVYSAPLGQFCCGQVSVCNG